MQPQYISRIWVGLVYFLILLIIALFVKDIPIQYNNLMYLTPNELISLSTYGDPATFISTALEIARDGWVTSANQWVLNLWPPGFVLLEALVIKIFGIDAPVILVLQILAAGLFSVVLTQLYEFLKGYVNTIIALILPLFIFAFPVSRVFLLEPFGISFGESFSVGFFLLGILLAIRSVGENSLRSAIYSGLFLGLSAYFRSQFELIIMIISIFLIIYISIILIYSRIKNYNTMKQGFLLFILYIVIAANVTTLPWRMYNYLNHDRLSWVSTSSLTYSNLVRTSEDLNSDGGGWIVEGRGNILCLIDQNTCGKIEQSNANLLIYTFLKNPVKWYELKFEVIGDYWFSEIGNWTNHGNSGSLFNILVNIGILLMLMFIIFSIIILKHFLIVKLLSWISVSVAFTYMIIFTVIHFEARYFYFPKIFIIFMFIILSSLFWKEKINEK